MIPVKPYLIRAIHTWIVDSHQTPYINVDANCLGVLIPEEYVEDGYIILDISPIATHNLKITNEAIEFSATFNSIVRNLYIPMSAISVIYSKETNQGMEFSLEDEYIFSLEDSDGHFAENQQELEEHNTTKSQVRAATTPKFEVIIGGKEQK